MIDKEPVIKAHNISKDFKLPHQDVNSVKGVFTNIFALGGGTTYEPQKALKDISFEVQKGEFFGIVGRNGSGKSTLLKILAGIYQPTKGSVEVKGKLVPFIELGVGFNPELSGRENVYLNGAMLGFSKKEVDHMYDEIVDFAELEKFMDQKLKNYSSGMQVRLAFACAVMAKTDILIVDEVLAVGDHDFQRKCFAYFKGLKSSGKTVILVTHDMGAVREYCDRAMLIEKSKIVKIGNVEEVTEGYHRLFDKPSLESSVRWGNGRAVLHSVKISPERITDPSDIVTLKVSVQAKEPIDSPLISFVVKNADGSRLFGANNLSSSKIQHLDAGDKLELEFKFQNLLSDGSYTVDVSVAEQDGITFTDCWIDAIRFSSKLKRPSQYPLYPKIEINQKN